MASLSLANIGETFSTANVLHDINAEISNGEFLVLVGPSGCGKSTLLGVISGLEDVTCDPTSLHLCGKTVG